MSSTIEPTLTLALTADERTRSRYRYRISSGITDNGYKNVGQCTSDRTSNSANDIYLELPRGTTLQDGDCLGGEDHTEVLRIVAKPESVLTVRASTDAQPTASTNAQPTASTSAQSTASADAQPPASTSAQLALLRAAYHLGNRHVALEVGTGYLRLGPDPVLESMLQQLGVTVTPETAPFQPESGAYGHHH